MYIRHCLILNGGFQLNLNGLATLTLLHSIFILYCELLFKTRLNEALAPPELLLFTYKTSFMYSFIFPEPSNEKVYLPLIAGTNTDVHLADKPGSLSTAYHFEE